MLPCSNIIYSFFYCVHVYFAHTTSFILLNSYNYFITWCRWFLPPWIHLWCHLICHNISFSFLAITCVSRHIHLLSPKLFFVHLKDNSYSNMSSHTSTFFQCSETMCWEIFNFLPPCSMNTPIYEECSDFGNFDDGMGMTRVFKFTVYHSRNNGRTCMNLLTGVREIIECVDE